MEPNISQLKMIKLKLNSEKLDVLCEFSRYTCTHISLETNKFLGRKKTIELIQLWVQLGEMEIFKRKLEILQIKKRDTGKNKLFSFRLSPIQSLLIITYTDNYLKHTKEPFPVFVLNEQKDIIYKELLTK